jgi:hypothetical protein
MCLQVSYKNIFFSFLKSLKKGVGSGSNSQRYGSGQCGNLIDFSINFSNLIRNLFDADPDADPGY